MTQHAYYEELCALAVSGQITPDQLKSLREHLEGCGPCLNTVADFGNIAGQVLEFAGSRRAPAPPSGMTARFIARAHSEGIPLSKRPAVEGRKWLRNSVYAVAAVLILFVGLKTLLFLFLGLKAWLLQWRSVTPTEVTVEAPSQAIIAQPHADLIPDNANLAVQLKDLQKRVIELEADLKAKKQALDSAQADKLQANAREAELEKTRADLGQELAARDSQVAQISAELARSQARVEQLVSARTNGEVQIQAARLELADLREKVSSLSDELNESQQLSAAAEQAKELIVARKLHIVDVDDTDGSGKRQRPFGRIFYTEGHNLVFYAYDLSDPRKLNTKIDFYVWGGREGVNNPVRSLGVFHPDDAKDGRWVLRFDDPSVLAEINCVFVTAEAGKKAPSRPTGQQILFASLGPRPNHP